jgi:hypothetical protein
MLFRIFVYLIFLPFSTEEAIGISNAVFGNVMPCRWVKGDCCLLPHDSRTLLLQKWGQQIPLKHLYVSTKLQNIASQKTVIFVLAAL